MIRPRSGRRALSENDAINISEAKISEISSRFKSENSERNDSRSPKDISEQQELLETEFKCSICLEMIDQTCECKQELRR